MPKLEVPQGRRGTAKIAGPSLGVLEGGADPGRLQVREMREVLPKE